MVSLIKEGKIEMARPGSSIRPGVDRVALKGCGGGEEIHCLIPETIYMVVPNGKMMVETQLIAVSRDKEPIGISSTLSN